MNNLEKENAMLKIALCKMINQFMYRIEKGGVEYFDNFCESAGKKAFAVLGIKENQVKVDEIKKIEKLEGIKLLEINRKLR